MSTKDTCMVQRTDGTHNTVTLKMAYLKNVRVLIAKWNRIMDCFA